MIMEGDPFVLIEGMTIAGIAVGATKGYHLSPLRISACRRRRWTTAIATARAAGCSARTSRARATPSTWKCASAPAPMSAARRPRCSKASKASAAWCAPSRRCRRIKGLFGKPTVINNVLSLRRRADHPGRGRGVLSRLRHGPLARHHADPARRQRQARRPVRDGLRRHARRARRRHRRRHARPAGRCARCRSAARSAPISRASLFDTPFDYEAFAATRRPDRPRRRRRLRRHRRHGRAGALRHGVLRHRIAAASARPAASARRAASRSIDRIVARRRTSRRTSRCSRTFATR